MATRAKPASRKNPKSAQVQQYVNKHIRKASHQVKITDLITGGIGMLVFAIGFFMMVAVIDAWVWPLSVMFRVVACLILIVGLIGIALTQLLPLVFRKINPEYAARMIEEAKPSFKNSLVNYLSLQKKDKPVHKAVFNAVSRQAATDLSTVTVDQTIDRSGLIRMGFILVVLSAIAIVYSMVSPKNPFQTIARVVAPTARIAKPASVSIENVSPGDVSVFFSDRLQVTAEVRGNFDPQSVRLIYTTLDGQQKDAVIPMEPNEISSSQFVAELQTCSSGIQQALEYFVIAGDGRSPVYSVDVRPNPVISVKQIEITPPTYTELPVRVIEGQGEIQAIEGSRIKISATANMPIDFATIELLEALNESPTNDQFRKSQTVAMKSEGKTAEGTFNVLMNSKRTKPRFTHYSVHFKSVDGPRNTDPNIFPIRVIADLPPEIQIVQPQQEILSVPANQPITVEVRANDLDFEISEVKIYFDNLNSSIHDFDFVLNDAAYENDELGNQRIVSKKTIRPVDLNWEPQDEILLHATAADNRMSEVSDQPDPNISRTKNYTLKITEPIKNVIKPNEEETPSEKDTPENSDDQKQDPNDQQTPNKKDSKGNGDSQREEEKSSGGESGNKEDGEEQDSGSENDESANSDQGNQKPDEGEMSQEPSESGNRGGQRPDDRKPADSEPDSAGGQDSEETNGEGQDGGAMEPSPDTQSEGQTGDGRGANTDAANQDPSNGDSGTNQGSESNRKSGQQDPTQGVEDGNLSNRDAEGANPEEVRDDSLTGGDIEPLSDSASEGEQMEQLQKLLDQPDKSSANPDNPTSDNDNQSVAGEPNNKGQNLNRQGEPMKDSGQINQGQNSQGENSQGQNSQGQNSQGENSQGENSQGENSQG
ncbi:MAG: hypothetical protein MK106_04525, partial [Mariniblastus sp.]|nr:hypothetical protein [Mariniblastus sp.]